jgi:hypothetical protein
MIDADEADAAVGGWLLAQVQTGRLAVGEAAAVTMVALDGKVLRGAWEELPDTQGEAVLRAGARRGRHHRPAPGPGRDYRGHPGAAAAG